MNQWKTKGQFETFDFDRMAENAARERDALQARLQERKDRGPESPEKSRTWIWENRMLYAMYLEQRTLAKEFQRRAQLRQ